MDEVSQDVSWPRGFSSPLASGLQMSFHLSSHPWGPFTHTLRFELQYSVLLLNNTCLWKSLSKLILSNLVLRLRYGRMSGVRLDTALSLIQHVIYHLVWRYSCGSKRCFNPSPLRSIKASSYEITVYTYSSETWLTPISEWFSLQQWGDELLHNHRCYRSKYSKPLGD